MNSSVDHSAIFAAIIAWNGMMTAAIVWLARIVKHKDQRIAALESELSEHRASTELIERCPRTACPLRTIAGVLLLCLSLVSCAPKTAEARHFDKSVLIVFRDETPRSGGALGAILEPLKPLIKLIIP